MTETDRAPRRELVSSGTLARRLGVSTTTIHRYQDQGLIHPAETTAGGHTRWDETAVRRQLAAEGRD